MGEQIRNRHLYTLYFADHHVVIVTDVEDLSSMTLKLRKAYINIQVILNIGILFESLSCYVLMY